jgi:Spy/CpxP family protein refolding chaperone
MKRIMIWSGAILLVVGTGIAILRADHPMRRGRWGFGPMGYISHQLKLSDAQRSQIQTIWQSEKPAVASLVSEFSNETKQMASATANGNFDESKVQAVANLQGQTLAKLLVEKQKVISKVYATVLTPEQRTKADDLQLRLGSHLDAIANRIEQSGK